MNVLDNPANAEVVAYLRQKASPNLIANIAPHSEVAYTDHTHPELGDLLEAASHNLPGRRTPHVYGFLVLANSNGVVCALAESTSILAFRLSEQYRSAALQYGAQELENIGKDWVAFDPWKLRGTDQERIAFYKSWCERAYSQQAG